MSNKKPTTDELLEWAQDNSCYIEIYGNGTALAQLPPYTSKVISNDLRTALMRAKRKLDNENRTNN